MKSLKKIAIHNLGYPRIGRDRELKKNTEAYWKGTVSREDLIAAGEAIRRKNWQTQKTKGIDLIPSNDFSFYDQMLDMSCLVGNVPERFQWEGDAVDIDPMFLMARGMALESGSEVEKSVPACEMTKWFDTNYHYIVPEFNSKTTFRLSSSKPVKEFQEALALGIKTKPVLIGPVTYLALGKIYETGKGQFNRFDLLDTLLPVYTEMLKELFEQGAEWVQLDEPIFSLNLSNEEKSCLGRAYETLAAAVPALDLLVVNYFGELRENAETFFGLPVKAFHIDGVRGGGEVETLARNLPRGKKLSLGLVDGRNVWINDYARSLSLIENALRYIDSDHLMLAPSCSLLHVPLTVSAESRMNPDIRPWLSFADEKLAELVILSRLAEKKDEAILAENRKILENRKKSSLVVNEEVKRRVQHIKNEDLQRNSSFGKRKLTQRDKLKLPSFPTTTIGSFPQTREVRAMRARHRRGEISTQEYDAFIKKEIEKLIRFQEEIDIDILVHGEFERNDMVEYFGEQLHGYAFTTNGWVQSYGSRYVKPPIIYGDIFRDHPMTTQWSHYAQGLTQKPMKGMLTGPVTMLLWSFVRDDQPRKETVKQIALALRDEVLDLEKNGIAAIQIDEPAFREGLPLRRSDWHGYIRWAVDAFRLSSAGVRDETQIHTHMCYSEFNDIIEAIAELDADVISIETSRSNMELLDAFAHFQYPNEIGPGVYDIHSPRVPSKEEMSALLHKAKEVLPPENLWVNPDCGLKTRGWQEVKTSLQNMVQAAKAVRD